MYFFLWHNYDGDNLEQTEDKDFLEKRIAEVKAIEDLPDAESYGTQIEMIIKGEELKYKTVEVTSKVLLIK